MDRIKVFNAEDVRKVITINKAIDAVGKAFIDYSSGRASNPIRTNINFQEENGNMLFMPAYIGGSKRAGIKIITLMKDNYKKGFPFIHALVMVCNSETGQPEALINGEAITALRTGAASGVATKFLAKQDAKSLAIIGAGVQAVTQFEAVCAVRNIEECIVFDINHDKIEKFINNFKDRFPINFKTGKEKSELKNYEIICTVSSGNCVLFSDADVSAGTHINAIGAYTPEMIEIPNETVARSKIVVDSKEAALKEAGDIIQAITKDLITEKNIYAEIGEIASGSVKGRTSKEEVTLFKSVGLAIQDLAVASLIIDECTRLNLGTEINL